MNNIHRTADAVISAGVLELTDFISASKVLAKFGRDTLATLAVSIS